MHLIAQGLLQQGQPESATANLAFPTVAALSDGSLIATWRAGSTKDGNDETVYLARSQDGGATWSAPWQPFPNGYVLNGVWGTIRVFYVTELSPGRLLGSVMWIDRSSYPNQPLFNPETEGCLPMSVLLAESTDNGTTWSPWQLVPMPDEIGPASLTSPVLKLHDGAWVLSIETNKQYLDRGKWMQRVVFIHSYDEGKSWNPPIIVGQDPTGRIFNWDLRCGVAPDGRIAIYAWTYDSETAQYLNVHRRISTDHGYTWSAAEDLGFADQPARPGILSDGRVVLAWVDRFGSRSICVRAASALDAPFDPDSQIVLYSQAQSQAKQAGDENTATMLADMGLWTFGLPYGEVLPEGDVFIVYYAGDRDAIDLHWARFRL